MKVENGIVRDLLTIKINPSYSVSYLKNSRQGVSKSINAKQWFEHLKEITELGPNSTKNNDPPKDHKPNGFLSAKAAQRLRLAIEWMYLLTPKKQIFVRESNKRFYFFINFITLTLSEKQKHNDNYIKQHLLQPFLYWMQRNYTKAYVWRAESQANGNIHFHITTDCFIHWKAIRLKWNKLLSKNKYIRVMQNGSHDNNPNSIDVHGVKNTSRVAWDMCKYISKNDKERRLIEGRLWACSEFLSNITCDIDEFCGEDFNEVCKFFSQAGKTIKNDFCSLHKHGNLKFTNNPTYIKNQFNLLKEKTKSYFCQQTFYEINSLN